MASRSRPLLAAMALAFSGPLLAQTATPALDTVRISGQRDQPLPASSGALNANEITTRQAYVSDTAQLLGDVPGVSLYGAGGVSSLPAIHGLADDRLRISVDGMDFIASCPNHMNPPLAYLTPGNIGKLQVYAGITPVSVGGDSIGGTIVAETLPPVFAAPGEGVLTKGEVGAFYRSNGDARGGNLSATAATENFNLSYTGSTAKAGNYQAGGDFKNYTATGNAGHSLGRDEVGSTAYETRTHTLGFAMKGGNHLLEAKIGYQEVPEQLYPNQRMDMLDNTQKRFNLRYLGEFDWGRFEARAYHEKVEHFMDFGADKRYWYGTQSGPGGAGGQTSLNGTPCAPIGPNCAAGMPMYTESTTTGLNLKADIVLSERDLLRVGGLYQMYRLDDWWPASGSGMWPDNFENIKDGKRDRAALFGEVESRFNDRWSSLLGLRFEQVKSNAGNVHGYSSAPAAMGNQLSDATAFNARNHAHTDDNIDLTALARYTPSANSDVEFGFARKVRSPNLYERYTWSTWSMAAVMNNFVGDGNGYIGNVNLKPEKAHTLSATVDWHAADRSWNIKATPFFTHVEDYIDAIRCTTGSACTAANRTTSNQFVTLQYANQSARLYGLDLSGQMPLTKNAAGQFGLKGMLNYTKGTNLDSGDDLYNIMPLNTKLTLAHQLGGWNNALELISSAGKTNVSDVRNEVKTASYNLTHLRGSYSWKQVRLDFGVENLFDKAYALPLGGAYLGQGRTMSINPVASDGMFGWGTAVPGMGRSLYAGINVKF